MSVVDRVRRKALAALTPATADAPQVPAADVVRLDSLTAARLLFFDGLIQRTQGVEGDIVECGVGTGRSLLLMAHVVHARQIQKNLWGFDSFEGFPEPTAEDRSHRNAKKGEWALPKQHALDLLNSHLGDELFFRSHISLIGGYFEDTLHVVPGPISILHLDCDLYQSYKVCLDALYPRVSPGGVIVFDEYHREGHAFPGAPKAIDEFFAEREVAFEKDPLFGKFFVTKP